MTEPDLSTSLPEPYRISIPDLCVVVLIGASGSGKSTFAAKHFLPTETLSSDFYRGVVSDDENSMDATVDAFEALHYLAEIRLRNRKLVVIDATNVQEAARKPLLNLAFKHDCLCVAIVLDVPDSISYERNKGRANRTFGPHVIATHRRQLKQSLRTLKREGFRYIHILNPSQIENLVIKREPLWTDRRNETGKFDIIGDVHGCFDELTEMLQKLGYVENPELGTLAHPEGRRAFFVGDLVDRGPQSVEVVDLVRAMMKANSALCVPGNHDIRLGRKLNGRDVRETHGLAETLEQIEALPEERRETFKKEFVTFADTLVSHFWLDGGALCVAHAGMKEEYIGRASGRVRDFALYGETTGETDEYGLPVRYNWAEEYRGKTAVVYGHTPVPEPEWLNNTLNLDTGCVFGGKLSCLRWPEREIVQVAAKQVYAEPIRPLVREDRMSEATSPQENSEKNEPSEIETSPTPPDAELMDYLHSTTVLVQEMTNRIHPISLFRESVESEYLKSEQSVNTLLDKGMEALIDGNSELSGRFVREAEMHSLDLEAKRARKEEIDGIHNSLSESLALLKSRLQAVCEVTNTPMPEFSAEPLSPEESFAFSKQGARTETDADSPGRNPSLSEKLKSVIGNLFTNSKKVDLTPEEALLEKVRGMREKSIANREACVQIISIKNYFQSEIDHLDAELMRLKAKLNGEENRPDDAKIVQDLEDQIAYLKPKLEEATDATESVKLALQEHELSLRKETLESLRKRSSMDYQVRIQDIESHLSALNEKNERIDRQFSLVAGKIVTLQKEAEMSSRVLKATIGSKPKPSGTVSNLKSQDDSGLSAQWRHDEVLRAEDVLGKRVIETRLRRNILVPAENAGAALEVMSRFALEPRWLIYLPPTMSPCETAKSGEYLEYPTQAFDYFREQGVSKVVCQKKHMGSRAVVIVCRDEAAAKRAFGSVGNPDSKTQGHSIPSALGVCYTRTGRQFFDDIALNNRLIEEVRNSFSRANLWEELGTDWACLDCELMPWNAKAMGLLQQQYMPVGAAGNAALSASLAAVEMAMSRGVDLSGIQPRLQARFEAINDYRAAYSRYCWEVNGFEDLKLAPFHLLATEGKTYFDKDHEWHLSTLAKLTTDSTLLMKTESKTLDLNDPEDCRKGVDWWLELTGSGGEGMVVKPLDFISRNAKDVLQPAVKVRGREYLRIIYGAEYALPENLDRLRARGLAGKRSLALREFSLGVESLERFVRKEPLRKVHECAFAVLALESEPVDPRL